jgi:hypothetical protein
MTREAWREWANTHSLWAIQTERRFKSARASNGIEPILTILSEIDDIACLLPPIEANRVRAKAFVTLAIQARVWNRIRWFETSYLRLVASMRRYTGEFKRHCWANRKMVITYHRTDRTLSTFEAVRGQFHERGDRAHALLMAAWDGWRGIEGIDDYRDVVLALVPIEARPPRRSRQGYCQHDWYRLNGGDGRLVHMRDERLSACFQEHVGVTHCNGVGHPAGDPNDDFGGRLRNRLHAIGWTEDAADVTCPRCLKNMAKRAIAETYKAKETR